MFTPKPKKLLPTLAATLALSSLAGGAFAQYAPVSPNLVISQVYGGGGSANTSATYNRDYVELFNNSNSGIYLGSYSLQYNSAAGTNAFNVSALSGTIAAHDYVLIGLGTVGTGGAALTTDLTGSLNLAAGSGQVALVTGSTALTSADFSAAGNPNATSAVVDFAGYGTATRFEGTTAAPLLTVSTADTRASTGSGATLTYLDTGSNSADFTAITPTPHRGVNFDPTPAPPGVISLLLGGVVTGLGAVRRRRKMTPAPTEAVA